jgi:ribosomal protein L25 (general stress protein Ctc)
MQPNKSERSRSKVFVSFDLTAFALFAKKCRQKNYFVFVKMDYSDRKRCVFVKSLQQHEKKNYIKNGFFEQI